MRLKELRQQNKLSQYDLAKHLKVQQPTYNRYETLKSEPDIVTLKKIADYYNVSLDYLLEHKTPNLIDTSSFSDIKKGCIFLIEKLSEENATILLGYITHMVQTQNKN